MALALRTMVPGIFWSGLESCVSVALSPSWIESE